MGPKLSGAAAEFYREHGYLAPIDALSVSEAEEFLRLLEDHERRHGPLKGQMQHRPHLLFTWVSRLIRSPNILDAVERLLGPNILAWSTGFFIKEPHDPRFVSWHQDSTYWGMDPPDILTAWLALTDSTVENGALRVVPGTHKIDQLPHRDTFAENNILSRGQEIAVDVDEGKAVTLELKPGQMSIHHVRLVHGSDPNPSAKRRIGLAIRYLPTHVRQTTGVRDSAILVRGVDAYRNFEIAREPAEDFSADARAYHALVAKARDEVAEKTPAAT
jgi:non-haem Fe2+, alpha-ketoglutarate-dependent halogenase